MLIEIARVNGSDKLINSNHTLRVEMALTMAQWLTLLEC